MPLRLFGLISALLAVSCVPVRAASIACTIQTYTSGSPGPINSQPCNSALSTPAASLNWGNVLSDTSAPNFSSAIDPLTASLTSGNHVSVASSDGLVGVQNAGYVWSPTFNQWVPSSYGASGTNTFAGDFATVTSSGLGTDYGDNLLGIIPASGASGASLAMTFQVPLSFIEFQVTSASNANFVATLVAFDAFGNTLGIYTVNDTGTGGNCASMEQAPPVACTPTSPFVQFYDPMDRIASVELTVNDPAGAYIDTLEVAPAPEPSSFAAFGVGILLLLGLRRRKLGVPGSRTNVSSYTFSWGVKSPAGIE